MLGFIHSIPNILYRSYYYSLSIIIIIKLASVFFFLILPHVDNLNYWLVLFDICNTRLVIIRSSTNFFMFWFFFFSYVLILQEIQWDKNVHPPCVFVLIVLLYYVLEITVHLFILEIILLVATMVGWVGKNIRLNHDQACLNTSCKSHGKWCWSAWVHQDMLLAVLRGKISVDVEFE